MKIYEITIQPLTGFGTPLKGDTLFGHFCWQLAYDKSLANKSLDDLLADYHNKPFAIFSSAYPKVLHNNSYCYAFKTPAIPLDEIFSPPKDDSERIRMRKELKARVWMLLKENDRFSSFQDLGASRFLGDTELLKVLSRNNVNKGIKKFLPTFEQPHNTINRLLGKTGEGGFAPFTAEQKIYPPGSVLALFIGLDEPVINIQQVGEGLQQIGAFGFGKDSSTGLGRFKVAESKELSLFNMGSQTPNACYTIGPCVPEKETFSSMSFIPFTRFGRHGDVLAKSNNPFKNPVIMADEGGVFRPKKKVSFDKPYIGTAQTMLSKAEPKAVMQGYALYIPVEMED